MNEFDYDVVIVGASFSGLTLAHHLPSSLRVLIVDAKPEAGSTVESTGLITTKTYQELEEFFPIDQFITNPISSICVVAPSFKDFFFSSLSQPWIFQTDTRGLVRGLASDFGAEITLSTKTVFLGCMEEEHGVEVRLRRNGEAEKMVRTKVLVGADGSHSAVAKAMSFLDKNERFLFGYEQVIPGRVHLGPDPEQTIYHFWFGEFSLGYGGWLSPTKEQSKHAFRVGLAKLEHDRGDAKDLLQKFVEKLEEKKIITIDGPSTYGFGSLIPMNAVRRRTATDHVILIGDAAAYCGAFAADGIKGAVVSGKAAANLIVQQLEKGAFTLRRIHHEVEARSGLMEYYKRQLRYRWIWDRMKRNRTFTMMWKIINRERETFLEQFCDSKDRCKSLSSTVLKLRHIPYLIVYAIYVLIDMIFS